MWWAHPLPRRRPLSSLLRAADLFLIIPLMPRLIPLLLPLVLPLVIPRALSHDIFAHFFIQAFRRSHPLHAIIVVVTILVLISIC